MHRNALKARLAAYRVRWQDERATVARFETFIDSHHDCFERSCSVGHITGSAWIVDRTGERVLLTHHRKLRRWLQLGGHSDGNPDTLAVALREAREESGLEVQILDETIFDLDVHLIPARSPEPAHYHFDVRFLVQTLDTKFRVSDESHALAWVPAERVDAFTHQESILRMARKWLDRAAGLDLNGPAVQNRPAASPLRSLRVATDGRTSASQQCDGKEGVSRGAPKLVRSGTRIASSGADSSSPPFETGNRNHRASP